MESLLQNLRFAFRSLWKSPGFTLLAVLMLAMGIGTNTAIFSLTDQVLLRLLPVSHPEELVVLRSPGPNPGHTSSDGDQAASFSYPIYQDVRDRNTVFSGLLARYAISLSVAGSGSTELASGELVTGNYFDVLGVPPALGRVFSKDDETAPGANPIAVLSYGYWMRHFGGRSTVLNQSFTVNGTPLTIVGVARAGFSGVQVGQVPDVFIPMTMQAQVMPNASGLLDRKHHWIAILGRLKPGITQKQAQSALQPIFHQILEDELPLRKISASMQPQFLARPLLLDSGSHGREILQQDVQTPLLVLMGMVGLVLLITCANLASLMIARGAARQREIAVRIALGAGRGRLIRELLAEPLLLSIAGGVAGIAFASWAIAAMVRAIPTDTDATGLSATLDWRVLLFSIGVSLLAGLLFGLAPAFFAAQLDPQDALKEQSATTSAGLGRMRLRRGLIVAQVALTAVLLIAAGLFCHSLYKLKTVALGLRPDHILQFSISPQLNRYTPPESAALFSRIRQDLDSTPGIQSVAGATISIFTDSDSGADVTAEGYIAAPNEDVHVFQNWITPDYFSTLGTPLLAGREFSDSDTAETPHVAVINQTFARQFFANRNPLGYHLGLGSGNNVALNIQIVGVVKDSKHSDARDPIHPFMYFPMTQKSNLGSATFYVRTQQDPLAMGEVLRKRVALFDPALPVFGLETLNDQIDDSMFSARLVAFLSIAMAALAALLAAIGLYAVMAYSVVRRTREIGIRMAIGASRNGVAWLVLREVVRLAAVGLVIGIPLAFVLTTVVQAALYGVKAADPLTYAAAGVLVAAMALLAGFLPARRATSVDPMVALRYE